jgi:hypothetical protein
VTGSNFREDVNVNGTITSGTLRWLRETRATPCHSYFLTNPNGAAAEFNLRPGFALD